MRCSSGTASSVGWGRVGANLGWLRGRKGGGSAPAPAPGSSKDLYGSAAPHQTHLRAAAGGGRQPGGPHEHAPTAKLTRGIMRQRASSNPAPDSPRGDALVRSDNSRNTSGGMPASGKEGRSVKWDAAKSPKRESKSPGSRGSAPAPAGPEDGNRFKMVAQTNQAMSTAL